MPARPVTRRQSYGAGHGYLLDGRKVPGASTVAGSAKQTWAIPWAAGQVADYVIAHLDRLPDLLADLGDEALRKFLAGMPGRERSRAAVRGTELHRLAEQVIRGEALYLDMDDPAEQEQAIMAQHLADFLDRWDAEDVLIEAPVFNRTLRYGGTLDVIAVLHKDGRCWLLDYTTGAVRAEKTLQVAGYAHCEFWIDELGEEHPLPGIDACGIVQVTLDGCELVPLADVDRSWDLFRSLLPVQAWLYDEDRAFRAQEPSPLLQAPLVLA